jgi:hypothetical protein
VNLAGVFVVVVGVLIGAQVLKGQALERLGVVQ